MASLFVSVLGEKWLGLGNHMQGWMVHTTQMSQKHTFPWVCTPGLTQFGGLHIWCWRGHKCSHDSGCWGMLSLGMVGMFHSHPASLLPGSAVPLLEPQLIVWDLGVPSNTGHMESLWGPSEQGVAQIYSQWWLSFKGKLSSFYLKHTLPV